MKYYKCTVRFSSVYALMSYEKSGRSFWNDLSEQLRANVDTVEDIEIAELQHVYYLSTSIKGFRQYLGEMISCLDVNQDSIEKTVVAMSQEDIELLLRRDTSAPFLAWLAKAAEAIVKEQSKKQKTEDEEDDSDECDSDDADDQDDAPADEDDATDMPDDLGKVAERILYLKRELLKVVHGQRHAVDEVVQTIFECEAFNRHDSTRRGPLASFLFTGPSGVGKTFLATQCAALLGRASMILDMSEFSDNLANDKFNGDHQDPAIVTGFIQKHPNGIIIFDEIEKAHINTIHLFLQILDSGRMMDMKSHEEVSFRDAIIFITTNAGSSLYEDPAVVDLSSVARRVILKALREEIKPSSNGEPCFPACITTRFANGHVLLFNHLEPFALMHIVRDEITKQIELFRKAYHVDVEFEPDTLAAVVLYALGGVADARTLRGAAKNIIVKELQDVVLQIYQKSGGDVRRLKRVEIKVDPSHCDKEVQNLFKGHDVSRVLVYAGTDAIERIRGQLTNVSNKYATQYDYFDVADDCKRAARGVVDYIILDPLAGRRDMTRLPNDIEDIDAEGIDFFRYLKQYYPEVPVYFLDENGLGEDAYATLLAKGGRGVVTLVDSSPEAVKEQMETLAFSALVNNTTFGLGRSGRVLTYNCSQYEEDETHAVIAFDKMALEYAPASTDGDVITHGDSKNGVTFDDIVGCKEAKKSLLDFCRYVSNPREMIMKGIRLPKGVLLYGPPGTGKTMLAKALANEAHAAFLPTTATSFFDKYVGESERKVRELFRKARRYAPAVIFIDEVDAIARIRTGSDSNRANENMLNALIAEMDGFATDEKRPVFVLAATNFDVDADQENERVLDPAFVRRFDRKIFVGLPDEEDRLVLLKKVLERHGVHFGEKHDQILENLADRSSGMNNADLTAVIDLFLRACEDKTPGADELMDALDAYRYGEIKESAPEELRQTACHESGHALIAALSGNVPAYLTIVSRGDFGGYMQHARSKKMCSTYRDLMNRVCISLGGRAAELVCYGEEKGMNTGASSDLEHARRLVQYALRDFAMGENLFAARDAQDCELEMRRQFERTINAINEYRDVLEKLTDLLVEKKSLNKVELQAFFDENLKKND